MIRDAFFECRLVFLTTPQLVASEDVKFKSFIMFSQAPQNSQGRFKALRWMAAIGQAEGISWRAPPKRERVFSPKDSIVSNKNAARRDCPFLPNSVTDEIARGYQKIESDFVQAPNRRVSAHPYLFQSTIDFQVLDRG
jgi:hypothetical protein